MVRIMRMVENGDADRLPVNRSIIVAPVGALAPGYRISGAGAIDDMTLPDLSLKPHGLGHAHGHCPLLGVAQRQICLPGMQCDFEVEQNLLDRQSAVEGSRRDL